MVINNFKDFLQAAFQQRCISSPGYTLSAFAKDLGMSRQKLNSILKHGAGLSPASAFEVSKKLNLNQKDQEIFMALVEAKHHRAKSQRDAAQKKIETMKIIEQELDALEAKEFPVFSQKWYYIAISVLVDLADFSPDPQWIARRLGISVEQAKEGCDKLFSAGFLHEENGRWIRDSRKYRLTSMVPSDSLQNYHRDIIHKAEESLKTEKIENRHTGTLMVSVTKDDIPFVKEQLEIFQHTLLNQIWARGGSSERLYALALNFFPVDKKESVHESV